MKCLVTGGGGFLGSEIVHQLIERGHRVRVLLRRKELPSNLDKVETEIFVGDIRNPSDVKELVKGVDCVFHTAAIYESTPFYIRYPKQLYSVNVDGTRNVCEACLETGVKKLIYTGSTAAIGLKDDGTPSDENIRLNYLNKRSHYEKSKELAEDVALSYSQKGLFVVSINPSFLIGPRDNRPTPTGRFILNFLKRMYPCYSDGILCLSDVKSAAKAHIDALELGANGERYIVGMDRHYTIKEMFDELERLSGVKTPPIKVPQSVLLIFSVINEIIIGLIGQAGKMRPILAYELVRYLGLKCRYDSSKAKKALKFKSNPFDEVLMSAVEWYVENDYVKIPLPNRSRPQ